MDVSGLCKLADFGVSSTLNSSLGHQRTVIGTPHWMAPEVLLSDEYNELADVWGLGVTAYELAIGEPPHARLHAMRAAVKIPQAEPPTLPDPETWTEAFHSFLRACLTKDPLHRPSAAALLLHPFIADAAPRSVLLDMISISQRAMEARERRDGGGSGGGSGKGGKVTASGSSAATVSPRRRHPADGLVGAFDDGEEEGEGKSAVMRSRTVQQRHRLSPANEEVEGRGSEGMETEEGGAAVATLRMPVIHHDHHEKEKKTTVSVLAE